MSTYDITTQPIALVPERTLGSPPDPEALHGRLSLGWDCLPVAEPLVPADWAAYAAADPGRSYRHLVLVCSFRPETARARGEFVSASLGLSLRTDEEGGPTPIARAIEPGERTAPVASAASTVSVGLTTGVLNVQAERRANDPAEARREWLVRGYGASQATPMWRFRRAGGHPLVGDHALAALVQTVPGRLNVADVLLAAEIEHRTLGIRRYRAELTPALSAITLPE
ncbi:hypothetical protein [Streptomyces sp. NPDC092952]|uniref:hypothetical protein n=1 Tax=Streptomyces sp. NPDC092952 TaxID=3366018 RepID=UPI003804E5C0